MAEPLNRHSRTITQGPDRAPSRAMFKAVGLTDEDLDRPLVGIANTWIEVMPCNFHLRRLSAKVKEGVRAAGGTPIEFNTVAVSDGISMGTEGMKASLVSREVIADSIELVTRGHLFDAVVALSGCDKTIPGTVMALARLDLPSLMLYGGSIMPGRFQGRDVTIQDVFEGVGAHAANKMTDAELLDLESNACPGPGACGGQFTANTMATAFEILGISPIGSASVPAMDDSKDAVAYRAGEMVMDLVRKNLTARRVITREALENAVASIAATGGSTNGVLHLLGVAREAEVDLRIDDFDRISSRTPLIADLKPGGRFVANDLYRAGGIPLVARRLLDAGRLNGDCMTVTGKTLGEEVGDAEETPGQEVVRPVSEPLKPTGGLVILRGNLAPEGCVVKVAGHERTRHSGPARVFDREEDSFKAVQNGEIKEGDVVVIRYEGPMGGPGMREMLGVTAALVGGRPRRVGGAPHRRPLLRRHPRPHGRPRGAGGRSGRPHRRGAGRRRHHLRRGRPAPRRGDFRGGDGQAPARVEGAGAPLRQRRHGQIRAAGVVGLGGCRNAVSRLFVKEVHNGQVQQDVHAHEGREGQGVPFAQAQVRRGSVSASSASSRARARSTCTSTRCRKRCS